MFKNILRLFLLIFFTSVVGSSYATTELPDLKEKEKKVVKGDSLTVKPDDQAPKDEAKEVVVKPTLNKEDTKVNYYGNEETVAEEDSTTNSALSFNFIYYIIEKFKFQVE